LIDLDIIRFEAAVRDVESVALSQEYAEVDVDQYIGRPHSTVCQTLRMEPVKTIS
jgi:hypothetical protein